MPRTTALETSLRSAFPNVEPAKVALALALMQGRYSDDTLDAIPAVVELRHRCYSEPGHHYKLMTALNSLLETHGVEALGHVHMHDGPPCEYLNVGDPYVATVVWYRDLRSQRFRVQGWADALEWLEKRRYATDDA